MVQLGNTLSILRPPERSTPAVQTGWNEDLIKNMHDVLGRMSQQITSKTFGGLPSGSARPASVKANIFWLDTSTATAPIVKLYDGADDITVMTFDFAANTVTFAGVSFDLVDDTTPQLGGDLDLNSNVITGLEIGTDVQAFDATLASLAAGSLIAASFIAKTADETVNNADTLQDDNHLFFAMAANKTYLAELVLLLDAASTTPDYKIGWTVPTSCTMIWAAEVSAGWVGDLALAMLTESSTAVADSRPGLTGAKFTAIVRNGANAGNLQLQWAQNTAHASNSKLLKHSSLLIHEMGAT